MRSFSGTGQLHVEDEICSSNNSGSIVSIQYRTSG